MYLKGVSTYQNASGGIRGQWTLARKIEESRAEVLARLLEELPTKIPAREGLATPPAQPGSEDLLAVYPMGDPHLGMLAIRGVKVCVMSE